jgi:hypothetical protein
MNWYPTGQTDDNTYYRTVRWEGTFNMASAGQISLSLAVDDDVWVFIDGILANEDHYGFSSNSVTAVSAGTHSIEMFYDDRIPVNDQITFSSSVPLSPVPEPGGCVIVMTGVSCFFAYKWRRRK